MTSPLKQAVYLLERHKETFFEVAPLAAKHGHPVPVDTRGWSQILVSVLTGIPGLSRKKGADLVDGSDVKAANTWEAIDTPRFNGVLKAGTKAADAGSINSLDGTPFLFLVLWDEPKGRASHRCRVWVVRPIADAAFREMATAWFKRRMGGEIRSNNFQLHPPRGRDGNVITNQCGNLSYPLLFAAEAASGEGYKVTTYSPEMLRSGLCQRTR